MLGAKGCPAACNAHAMELLGTDMPGSKGVNADVLADGAINVRQYVEEELGNLAITPESGLLRPGSLGRGFEGPPRTVPARPAGEYLRL